MPSKGIIGEIIEVRRSAQELRIEWPIPNILSLDCGQFDFFESPRFIFWNGCWNLRVWPKGFSKWVEPGLYRQDSATSLKTINVAFGIKGSNGVEKRKERVLMFSNDRHQYLSFDCLRSELRMHNHRLMPNNVFTLICEMKIPVQHSDARGQQSSDECVICCTEPIDCAFNPCGHTSCCYECALRVEQGTHQCPLCRKTILSVLKLYKSA